MAGWLNLSLLPALGATAVSRLCGANHCGRGGAAHSEEPRAFALSRHKRPQPNSFLAQNKTWRVIKKCHSYYLTAVFTFIPITPRSATPPVIPRSQTVQDTIRRSDAAVPADVKYSLLMLGDGDCCVVCAAQGRQCSEISGFGAANAGCVRLRNTCV